MKRRFRRCALLAAFAALCLAQAPQPADPPPVKLPSGKLQRDEMLKEELTENRKDAAQLVELAQQLHSDLDQSSRYVFSLADHKKAEDIERLAHRIHARMQHY